jgi:CheY-like chemotaxis protein
LSKLGDQVDEAIDGRGAWEAWQKDHYSLVISDWMMRDVDGLELCRRICLNERADSLAPTPRPHSRDLRIFLNGSEFSRGKSAGRSNSAQVCVSQLITDRAGFWCNMCSE